MTKEKSKKVRRMVGEVVEREREEGMNEVGVNCELAVSPCGRLFLCFNFDYVPSPASNYFHGHVKTTKLLIHVYYYLLIFNLLLLPSSNLYLHPG